MHRPSLFVGLMSGTSLDAIDATLVAFDDAGPHLEHALAFPWPATLAAELRALGNLPSVTGAVHHA